MPKNSLTKILLPVFLLATAAFFSSGRFSNNEVDRFPYKIAGLSERQAAAHLLNRFTFGIKPGDIEKVQSIGLEKWFLRQLETSVPDDSLKSILTKYPDINLTNTEALARYPQNAAVKRMALKEGVLDEKSLSKTNKAEYVSALRGYMQENDLKPQRELFRQMSAQKILRAAYSENQLQEVLTDFWFNHFNVSLTKNNCAVYIPAYERDVIRPNSLGKFSSLLIATAKSPAMLFYLDNYVSSASVEGMKPGENKKKGKGLNENYAREVMELHTLGVDGGYTQSDVTQAARILTGWTVFPSKREDAFNDEGLLTRRGFVREGDFLFAMNRHDRGEKVVLGQKFPAGRGYEEGVEFLNMLAGHPSTAKFISRKLAVRFVSDNPPQSLINRMSSTFTTTKGDIKEVLKAMVSSPEFWSPEALRQKVKSPFELAISTVRSVNAKVTRPEQLYNRISKMGQKLYAYQAPTGFPDKGSYWINTGSLLTRMNFGLDFAGKKIPGIEFDLEALNRNREPESAEAALLTYSNLMMPERNAEGTLKRLAPMVKSREIENKINKAAKAAEPKEDEDMLSDTNETENVSKPIAKNPSGTRKLAQVVGIIIGSPEFQRK